MEDKLNAFRRLLAIMDELREKCPWDQKQTLHTLSSLTLEETYELLDEIEKGDFDGVKEELGDLMLHLVFYARIASETKAFDIADVLNAVCEKLIRRHPHVYANRVVEDENDVKKNWEEIKLAEGNKTILGGVPNALPALIKAQRMQEKVAQFGFDWEDIGDVKAKVIEELDEMADVSDDQDLLTEEFGDLLFSLVNYARFKGIDANRALDLTNRKFRKRFEHIERQAPKPLNQMTLTEMDLLWNESKQLEVIEEVNRTGS